MEQNARGRRWTTVAVSAALAAGALIGAQITAGSAAAALPGRHIVPSPPSASNSNSIKQVVAYCSSTERVIGGGAYIQEVSAMDRKPTLTELRPIDRYDGTRDAYRVTAAETSPGTPETWLVQAYAVCVPKAQVHNWAIVPATSPLSSKPMQAVAAVCPAGRRVLGTGISVSDPFGDVVLQVTRPSGPGDIARAQAHEGVNGYAPNWSVTSYAICTDPPPGYVIPPFGKSLGSDSEEWKIAGSTCPAGKYAHSAGAALSNLAPANVSLQAVYPAGGDRSSQAIAVENTATNQDWDYIVASVVCAN